MSDEPCYSLKNVLRIKNGWLCEFEYRFGTRFQKYLTNQELIAWLKDNETFDTALAK